MDINVKKLSISSWMLGCLLFGTNAYPSSYRLGPSTAPRQHIEPQKIEPQKKDGNTFYVAPDGKHNGNGKKKNPWDLRTALSQPTGVQPGATIYLRGGVYKGKFLSALSGTQAWPITLRSAPGEWAVIDGNGVDSAGDDTAHSFQVAGDWTIYRNFEVMNSSSRRVVADDSNRDVARRGSGVVVFGKNNKLINLIVHDNVSGVYLSASAENTEVYGVISYNNGLNVSGGGVGHGIYVQNLNGVKQIRDSIVLNNFGYGIQAFADNNFLLHITIDGNIIAGNGMPATRGSSGRAHIFVGSGTNGADDIVITNNYTYNRTGFDGGGFALGYGAANGSATITDNYLMGGASGVGLVNWANATVTGNTIYVTSLGGKNADIGTVRASPGAGGFCWNNNAYYDTSATPAFKYTAQLDMNWIPYAQWRQISGYDQGSSYNVAPPTWTRVFVRPNKYEPGRAHIIVYNFASKKRVAVDLSTVLSVGDNYEIRDAQSYTAGPVASGTYSGGLIRLSLARRLAASPIGFDYVPVHTGPEFNVFVVTVKAAD